MTAITDKAIRVGTIYVRASDDAAIVSALRQIVARGNDRTFADQYVATNENEGD